MSGPESNAPDLGTRTFNGPFAILWALFLFLLFGFVGIPLAHALVVCWVRGTHAYFQEGIRVLKGRPLKFSDGVGVPGFPEAVTGLAVFIVITFGLSFLLLFILRYYEKHFRGPKPQSG